MGLIENYQKEKIKVLILEELKTDKKFKKKLKEVLKNE
jgi:hypothetical protein